MQTFDTLVVFLTVMSPCALRQHAMTLLLVVRIAERQPGFSGANAATATTQKYRLSLVHLG